MLDSPLQSATTRHAACLLVEFIVARTNVPDDGEPIVKSERKAGNAVEAEDLGTANGSKHLRRQDRERAKGRQQRAGDVSEDAHKALGEELDLG